MRDVVVQAAGESGNVADPDQVDELLMFGEHLLAFGEEPLAGGEQHGPLTVGEAIAEFEQDVVVAGFDEVPMEGDGQVDVAPDVALGECVPLLP